MCVRIVCWLPLYILFNFFVHFKAFHIMMIADILNAMRPHTDFQENVVPTTTTATKFLY